jgi:hypothetical protein
MEDKLMSVIPRGLGDFVSTLNRWVRRDSAEFVNHLSEYFREHASVTYRGNRTLHILPVSVDVSDSLFHKEVLFRFMLDEQEPATSVNLEDVAACGDDEPQTYEFYLSRGTEIMGRQILFFTFSSAESLERNIMRFRRFVRQSYVTPEEIANLNRQSWDRLAFERRRLESEHSLILDDESATKIWQGLLYLVHQKYGDFHDRRGGLLDLDTIVEDVIYRVLATTGPAYPRNLTSQLFHAIETEVFNVARITNR